MTTQSELQDTPIIVEETLPVQDTPYDESPLADTLGKLGLASIGAVSLALEGAEKLLHRMVERGAADERNARRMLKEFGAKRPRLPRPPRPVIAVGTGNLASKSDIEALEQQVAALSAQIEHLTKGASEGA
jgi:polyhydroxyalkanoate synthesis regulator phasin